MIRINQHLEFVFSHNNAASRGIEIIYRKDKFNMIRLVNPEYEEIEELASFKKSRYICRVNLEKDSK